MELFTNQVLAGIATGAIYACMALAVVMIYQAIDHLNFAQGEMAMFSTFISWQLMQWGIPYWWAFLITIAFSFGAGIAGPIGHLLNGLLDERLGFLERCQKSVNELVARGGGVPRAESRVG